MSRTEPSLAGEATDGLICAYLLDGAGAGRQINWEQVRSWTPDNGPVWVHLNRKSPGTRSWLEEEARLTPLIVEALLAEDTRPRSLVLEDAMLVILRGVNLNPGSDPEDMVSLRLWVDPHRVITLRFQHLMAIEDLRSSLESGSGPKTSSEFLAATADRLIDRMAPTIDAIDDGIDALEENLLKSESRQTQSQLAALRRQAISLRRYIAPQREALARISNERLTWLREIDRARLREVADRVTRYVEDLDAARERAAVTQEEIVSRLSTQMNRTMYILSLVAAVFLPLGLITGLLGINVGGIPGSENKLAFLIVCGLLVLIAVLQIWLFRKRHWF